MPGLPAMLNLEDRAVLIVGGGKVAVRRAEALLECGAEVRVVAPAFDERLFNVGVTRHQRCFEPCDLEGVFAVCVATDNDEVNEHVSELARKHGVLVNRCDNGSAGDFTVPAHGRRGRITVAVDTDGVSPSTSVRLRDALLEGITTTDQLLIDAAAEYRGQTRETVTDPAARAALLRRMTGSEARAILEADGAEALQAWLGRITAEAGKPASPAPRSR